MIVIPASLRSDFIHMAGMTIHIALESTIHIVGIRTRKQDTSVSQAKQAISDYKKAVGDPEGVAELMVFYCEQAAGFCDDICSDDEGCPGAQVRAGPQVRQRTIGPTAEMTRTPG